MTNFVAERLEQLKQSFDRSFAVAPGLDSERFEDFLSIRVAGDAYAVRLSEAAGLYVDRKVVGLPGPVPELLGMAGFRGSVVPVFDLAAFLGYSLTGDVGHWMLLVGKNEIVGLSFQEFEGYLRAPASGPSHQASESMRQHVREVVAAGGIMRPVVDLASVVQTVRRRVASAAPLEGV